MDKKTLLQKAVDFFNSASWQLVLEDYSKELDITRNSLEMFVPNRDEEDDYMKGRITELKKVIQMKDTYKKDLDELTEEEGGE